MSIVMNYAASPRAIAERCPAVFATQPNSNVSKVYNFYSTQNLMDAMSYEGFFPASVSQVRSRLPEQRMSARHVLTFRHNGYGEQDGVVPQVVIMNSHDGKCAYKVYCGFFRYVCSNGLVVGETIGSMRILHKGESTNEDVVAASMSMINKSREIAERIEAWKHVILTDEQRIDMANAVYKMKFGDKETPIRPIQFLTPHNEEDYRNINSLWSTFNVLQENLIKGGLTGYRNSFRQVRGQHMSMTTRAVTNVTLNVKYNTALWDMAEEVYAQAA